VAIDQTMIVTWLSYEVTEIQPTAEPEDRHGAQVGRRILPHSHTNETNEQVKRFEANLSGRDVPQRAAPHA